MDVLRSFQQSQATIVLSLRQGICALGYTGKVVGVYPEDGAFSFVPNEHGPRQIIISVRESKRIASTVGLVMLDNLFLGSDAQPVASRVY